MKVLSLFDGISCGMVALERAGIPVERYVAYEIEPNAIKISQKNYPQIEHCGDVTTADFTQYEGFDLLIGGSPCQSLSIVRSKTREHLDGKSRLFFEYARALKEMKPKYFLFENVASMNEESKGIISEILGCKPVFINSNCFVAQDRPRLYWTNIPVDTSKLKECDLKLSDILQDETEVDPKMYYDYPLINIDMSKRVCATMVSPNNETNNRIFNPNFKVHTLLACNGGGHQKKVLVGDCARKLTPLEYERLQGLPDGYTEGIANTHRYNALGNGWTVDVIAHIFTGIKNERSNKEMELKMNDYQLPEQIMFNYEELMQELTEKVSMYETLVYTDAQIKEAKADRANLNKLKDALKAERIRREKEYMEPFNAFKAKINEIIGIIDRPIALIDRQVKEYEEKQKQDKMDEIRNFWNSCDVPEGLVFEKIFDSKWLNASVSMKSIHEAIDAAIEKFNQDMSTLANLPEFGFEAQQIYISTLDLNKAIAEGHRMSEIAKAKAEREAAMRKIEEEQKAKAAEAEQIPGQVEFTDFQSFDAIAEKVKPARQWVRFQAFMTTEDAIALKDFFNRRNIEFKAV